MTRDTAWSTRRAGTPESAGGGPAPARALGGGTLWLPEGLAMAKSWHFCSHTARDVPETCADTTDLERAVGFRSRTPSGQGVVASSTASSSFGKSCDFALPGIP